MVYRVTPHSVTRYSPYFLVHGREANLPTKIITSDTADRDLNEEDYVQEVITRLKEAFSKARDNINKNKETSKQYYDEKSSIKIFQPGELVLLLNTTVKRGRSKKLKRPWIGPYKVLEKISDSTIA